jgi:hypothetical protein
MVIFAMIAYHRNLETMKWLLENKFQHEEFVLDYVATNENLENIKWFAETLPGSLRETQFRCVLASPIILKIFYN